jgi:hypothetical protein
VEGPSTQGDARARITEEFMDDPQVKFYQESVEENTELRDSFITFAQVLDGLT